ncbi:hypothetical protein FJV23_08895 [Acinetobacter baumannii]|nr:hypothetical protein J649_0329 [Acinetobacter baumannii 1064293_45]OXU59156.1 hypothetical protein CEB38_03895 [Acinetobacter baumannii]PNN47405.1 hypothetical protein AL484_012685 [Acinetobacter baumannii]QLF10158.1 hypothetical protein F7R60_08150 [Acinetobacter baumannii]TPV15987.1 hypothetical protein FJV23_08895 [Acinetobacter baumannii]
MPPKKVANSVTFLKSNQKLSHPQNLFSVFIFQKILQIHYLYKLGAGCGRNLARANASMDSVVLV